MNELSVKQVGAIISLSIISLKLFLFPAIVSRYSLNDCYLSVLLSLAVEFLFIMFLLWVMKKNPNMTLTQILQKKFGKWLVKGICVVLTLFFMGKALVAMKELQNFFVQLLFEHISWWKFAVPLICVIVFVLNKSFRTFARSVQFIYVIIFVGAGITLILPLNEVSIINLLPIMADGVGPVLEGAFHTCFQFIDFFVLLIIMGRVKYSANLQKTVVKYTLFTDLFLMVFFIVFVGLFGNIVINQGLVVSDVPLYSNYPSNNGRLEWLSLIVWTIVLVFQASLMLLCARESLAYSINIRDNRILSAIIAVFMAFALYLLYLNYAMLINIITSTAFNIVLLSFVGILCLCLLICSVGGKYEANLQKTG